MGPILFYTVGYPGAGKTTLAARLSFLLNAEHLRGDKIGLELFRVPTFSPEERRAVYAEMHRQAAVQLRAGRPVLYDAAANTRQLRSQLETLAQQQGGRAVGIWLEVPVGLARRRAAQPRDSGLVGRVVRIVPPQLFDQYAAQFEAPTPDERILSVSGDAPFSLQYRRLVRQLRTGAVRSAPLPRLIQ